MERPGLTNEVVDALESSPVLARELEECREPLDTRRGAGDVRRHRCGRGPFQDACDACEEEPDVVGVLYDGVGSSGVRGVEQVGVDSAAYGMGAQEGEGARAGEGVCGVSDDGG